VIQLLWMHPQVMQFWTLLPACHYQLCGQRHPGSVLRIMLDAGKF
jgi:hypothetical protein